MVIGKLGGGGIDVINEKACAEIYINGAYHYVYSDKTLETGKKYNFTCTYDGQNIKLYIDGELQSEEKVSGIIGKPDSNTVMAIGVNPSGNIADGFSPIKVYSARIYDRALSQEEIQQNIKAY